MARIFSNMEDAVQAAMQIDRIFIRQVLYDSGSKQEFQLVEKISATDHCVFCKTIDSVKRYRLKEISEKESNISLKV